MKNVTEKFVLKVIENEDMKLRQNLVDMHVILTVNCIDSCLALVNFIV